MIRCGLPGRHFQRIEMEQRGDLETVSHCDGTLCCDFKRIEMEQRGDLETVCHTVTGLCAVIFTLEMQAPLVVLRKQPMVKVWSNVAVAQIKPNLEEREGGGGDRDDREGEEEWVVLARHFNQLGWTHNGFICWV